MYKLLFSNINIIFNFNKFYSDDAVFGWTSYNTYEFEER
jgi:hypothetical protein